MSPASCTIARKWLHQRYGVVIRGYMAQLGSIELALKNWNAVDQNAFFCADPGKVDHELYDRFVAWLCAHSQINGSFYKRAI